LRKTPEVNISRGSTQRIVPPWQNQHAASRRLGTLTESSRLNFIREIYCKAAVRRDFAEGVLQHRMQTGTMWLLLFGSYWTSSAI
jgi:hypothetical protein